MPSDQTVDFVVAFIMVGLLVLGLGSVLLGKIVAWWDWLRSVKDLQIVMSRANEQTGRTDQTDEQTDTASAADDWLDRLEVDRTKTTLIELLVYSGWTVSEIRGQLKGDNAVIGAEIEAARHRLGMASESPRPLVVNGERIIHL